MNEEEKDAIEQLKSWREYIIKHKEKVNKANDIEFYIRTVLNLVYKLQNIIEINRKLNAINCKLNANMSERHFNDTFKIKKYQKQIDLMAEWIEKHTKYYDEDGCYCEVEKKICEKDIECKDCIKQYFEKLAKEKGE